MQIFFLDLWHDLREKRLWPVAVVLLLGLVAVPVLLAKPAGEPSPPPVAAVPNPDEQERETLAALAKVKLGEEAVGTGSTLGVFDPDNPFSPPKGTIEKDDGGGQPDQDGGPVEGTTPGGGDTGDGGSAPDTGGGTGPDSGDGDGGTQTVPFKYVVDVTFAANGRTRRIKGMEKLDMLPNDSSPLLIFMGVTAKGADAVFLVDSTLEAAGEGRCKPSENECAFAYIGPGAEYVFTEEDGDTYTIRIDEIRKVRLSTTAAKAKGAKGATARASVGAHRRFVLPTLVDLVEETTDQLDDSTDNSDSR
jgi:hypothetical protein